jgi:hypothetical protein
VQFRWGTLIFNGVISQHQEVFDYFSPSGVPLRSKVSSPSPSRSSATR